MNVVSEICLGM